MKITKPFCIDGELIDELSKVNASFLVNSLLKEHFNTEGTQDLTKLRAKLRKKSEEKAILLKEIRDLKKKIKEISEKENKILKITRGLSKEEMNILENCRSRVSLSLVYKKTILKNRRWIDVKQIWQELKGGE